MNSTNPIVRHDPPMVAQARRASRFSFGLRTLFVLVTVSSLPLAWTGYSLSWIRQRHEVLDGHAISRSYTRFDHPSERRPPGGLWVFGEQGLAAIFLNPLKPTDKNRIHRLFPEADVFDGP